MSDPELKLVPVLATGDAALIAVAKSLLEPFFIDWGSSPHPESTAAKGAELIRMRAEHPDPPAVERMLRQLGVDLAITRGPRAALIATIDTPRGRVELR